MRIMRVVKDLSPTETKESELVAAVAPVQGNRQYHPVRRAPEVIGVANSDLQHAALTQRRGASEPGPVARDQKQCHCDAMDESLDAGARLARHGEQRLLLPVVTGTVALQLST